MAVFLYVHGFLWSGGELFLENKDNYHLLIRTLRPNWRRQQRAQTEKMRQKSKSERADRKNNKNNNKMIKTYRWEKTTTRNRKIKNSKTDNFRK